MAELNLEIGGVKMRFTLPAARWLAPLLLRYADFVIFGPPDWFITVAAGEVAVAEADAWIRHAGPVTHFEVPGLAGSIDLAQRQAAIATPSPSTAASAIERTAGYILMQALPREQQALWLHACGVVLGGRGHVFFGPSGAGKTTIARLAARHTPDGAVGPADVICDENVILRITPGGPELLSTPFWGHSTPPELVRRVNRRVPLAALYHLTHKPDFSAVPLSPAEAVAALLTTEKVATERVDSANAWLEVAGRLVTMIPIYRLGFRPTVELWDFLANP